MDEALAFSSAGRQKGPTLLAAEVAAQQWGVISWRQLRACGVTPSMAHRWRMSGRLHVVHRSVFALGHRSIPIEGRLVAALLHAGDDALLSHTTAAWWWGLIEDKPGVIEVSSKLWARSCPGVVVHHPRYLERTRHRRFPITPVAQTLVDYASTAGLVTVRRALARADYLRLLDPGGVASMIRQGKPGSARLRKALARHQPSLAHTRSWLETVFVALCETAGIALPELGVRVTGWTVDALWREEKVVVELDGYGNHHTRAQIERDRRKELELRAAGFLVIRYTWEQVVHEPELVAADLHARLAERRAWLLSSTVPSGGAGSR